MGYDERLTLAMKRASVTSAQLAKALGVSYQAVKKLLDGKTGAFSAANNAKAAMTLRVSSHWLATGEGSMEPSDTKPPPVPATDPALSGLSAEALQLALLFDQLPADVVQRARTWNAASTVILEALSVLYASASGGAPQTTQPRPEPHATDARQKGSA